MPRLLTKTLPDAGAASLHKEFSRFAEIIGALTSAIDLAEGNSQGHALRTCVIGMKIGRRINLEPAALSDLYYALLLKDFAGSHTQAMEMTMTGEGGQKARRLLREGHGAMSWRETVRAIQDLYHEASPLERMRQRAWFLMTRKELRAQSVLVRCSAAADLLKALGVSGGTRDGICAIDEQWNGRGAPAGLRGRQIPVIGQIVKLAQTMDFFYSEEGGAQVIPRLHAGCRGWFDPGLVAAATRLFEAPSSWWQLEQKDLLAYTVSLEPREHVLAADGDTIDNVCQVFAEVADAHSIYSVKHSTRVADIAVRIARVLGISERQVKTLRRAALLHDIGKLVVPRQILERDGSLTEEEITLLRTYPLQTFDILRSIPEFDEVAHIAMSHHERLDGSGYPNGVAAGQLSVLARILAVADVAEALAAERSFRKQYSGQQIYKMMMELTPHQLDVHCVNALLHESVISLVA